MHASMPAYDLMLSVHVEHICECMYVYMYACMYVCIYKYMLYITTTIIYMASTRVVSAATSYVKLVPRGWQNSGPSKETRNKCRTYNILHVLYPVAFGLPATVPRFVTGGWGLAARWRIYRV